MPVRYKKFGQQEYAYEIWNEKDPVSGKWIQRSRYLGVVIDKEKAVYAKRLQDKSDEQYILDYGDCYYFREFLIKENLLPLLKTVFTTHADTIWSLALFKLQGGSAMRHAQTWYEGSAARLLFPQATVSTQSISSLLDMMGKEKLQRRFFQTYLQDMCPKQPSIIIDSTGLPNQIKMPITEWGYHDGTIEKEVRLILAVEKESKMPLYFRYVAGNIGDVSTLITTISELQKLGVKPTVSIIDAGYCSEDNIQALYRGEIGFLTRLPTNRILYQDLVAKEAVGIERLANAVVYGKRGLFIKKQQVDLYGHLAYAYIVCDPVRRGAEVSKSILGLQQDDDQLDLQNCGIMVLVSNMELDTKEVVPLYYARQAAEQLFGISKADLHILPVRVHSEARFRGLMLLSFITLVVYLKLKKSIEPTMTVEQLLLLMRNLKCKVYNDHSLIIGEVNKEQREAFEKVGILVPKRRGI